MAVAYSMDLRIRAQQELAKKTLCMRELSEKYSISISTLHSWRRYLARHGTLQTKQRIYSGRRPKFFHPEPILDRAQELANHFNLTYSATYSYLQRFKIKLKKIYTYKEACPEQRDLFLKEVEAIPLEDHGYLDESLRDESLVEDRAYALRGQKIYAIRCGNRKKFNRKSLIAVHTPQRKNLLVAPFLYEGTWIMLAFIRVLKSKNWLFVYC